MCLAGLCYCGDDAGDAKGTLKGVEKQNPPGPTDPSSSLASKVDSTLFNVLCSVEDNVKVLKLTAKEGVTAKSITYGSDVVWEDKKKSCSSAVLYMDGEKPTLAVLVTRDDKNNKQSKVYRYHDGKQWKDGNENKHKKKLEELKKKYELTNLITLSLSEPDPSICRAVETNVGGIPAVVYLLKSKKVNTIVNGDKDVWKGEEGEKCFYCVAFLKENKPRIVAVGAESSARKLLKYYKYKDKTGCRGKPGWSSATSCAQEINALKTHKDPPKKFTLDLSSLKEDDERFELVKCGRDDVNRLVTPQPGHLIERIVDGNLEVWTASDNQVCYLCEYYPKSASGKVKLHIMKNKDSFSFIRFQKVDDKWKKK
ncbi:hypothetical protein BEWA_025750 [Theileria equi strain WA]|uniref:Signal peptide containing protein n=1 Tax=Theileria equi strain WA TaxID=1537102 RepID=L0AXH4_THEEQ|nr:hypothetical protein BEWA_025750 [Theileria equi strain WA]AFZ79726.1 hypothetical protein BEWA_025750 [Theileria equi strain WA]|eukprot:XP_004829392.1 hypothetical protein BEWA_025750 [Theileria equi strain WA]